MNHFKYLILIFFFKLKMFISLHLFQFDFENNEAFIKKLKNNLKSTPIILSL